MKINDLFVAGTLAGLLANLPKMVTDIILYRTGFSEFFCFHVTGGVILAPRWFDTIHGILIGAGIDFIFAGVLGVSLALFLYYLPGRHLFLKGIGFSLFVWLFLCIMIVEKVSMWRLLTDPWHAYQTFMVHQIWGVVATYLLLRFCGPIKRKDE